jgi:hypothetical protein
MKRLNKKSSISKTALQDSIIGLTHREFTVNVAQFLATNDTLARTQLVGSLRIMN